MRSVMTHQFSQVPRAEIPRSSFNRSHGYKTTFNAGYVVPIYVDEALPGDTFHLTCNSFGRLSTPLHPFMDNLHLDFHFFAVPLRLVWSNFKKFFGEQDNPTDSTSFLVPTVTAPAGGFITGSMQDYMGVPPLIAGIAINSLPFRAYNKIWNEWYRDQNLQVSRPVPMGDGPDTPADMTFVGARGKRHDYFTSCLPWPQKGPAVTVPLGAQATVRTQLTPTVTGAQAALQTRVANTGAIPTSGITLQTEASAGALTLGTLSGGAGGVALYPANLYADLSTATASTINQLRQAFQIQKIYERDARGGTRYTELIRSHFGVTSPDARLQRSEYLGGGTTHVNVNPIAQTSNDEASPTPLGTLGAMGTVSNRGVGFSKSFTEHCYIIGMVSARADLTYQDGIDRMWSRSTRWDFYWPALAHIGEQAVLNKEIYAQGTAADNNVFGYQERFAEYRYKPSIVSAHFRSSSPQSLDTWHLSQDFSALPVLNATFIEENPPLERVLAVPTESEFLLDCFFNLRCARPMPLYGVPGNIDRF